MLDVTRSRIGQCRAPASCPVSAHLSYSILFVGFICSEKNRTGDNVLRGGVVFMDDSERQGIGWTEGRQALAKPQLPSLATHRGDGVLLASDRGIAA